MYVPAYIHEHTYIHTWTYIHTYIHTLRVTNLKKKTGIQSCCFFFFGGGGGGGGASVVVVVVVCLFVRLFVPVDTCDLMTPPLMTKPSAPWPPSSYLVTWCGGAITWWPCDLMTWYPCDLVVYLGNGEMTLPVKWLTIKLVTHSDLVIWWLEVTQTSVLLVTSNDLTMWLSDQKWLNIITWWPKVTQFSDLVT